MKQTVRKNYLKGILFVCIFTLLESVRRDYLPKDLPAREQTITVGVFSDSYWEVQNGYSYQIIDDAIQLFEKENPNVRVKYVSGILKNDYSEWLAEQLLSGKAPDVFFILGSDFNNLSQIGALKDLGKCMEKDPEFDKSRYYASAYKSGTYMKEQFALPYECAPKLMFVNRTLLDKEGLKMPKKGWNWQEFYQLCKKVTKDTDGNGIPDQFGVVGYSWQDAFYENGVQIFSENGSECRLSGECAIDTIQFLDDLKGLDSGYEVTDKEFNLGKVAFMPMSFSEYRAYKSYPLSIKKYSGFEWECVEMPAGPKGENTSQIDTLLLGMNARTQKEGLAWKFMKLLTMDSRIQSEIFDYSEGLSVLKEVTESDETKILLQQDGGENVTMNPKVLGDVLDHAVTPSVFSNFDQAMEQVDRAIDGIMRGHKNIRMELIVKNREINKYLRELQQKK